MTTKEIKEQIKKAATFKREEALVSQSCGMPTAKAHLVSDEIGIEIVVSNYRSNFKNRELAVALFDVAIDKSIRD
jgi:hypothetical protein